MRRLGFRLMFCTVKGQGAGLYLCWVVSRACFVPSLAARERDRGERREERGERREERGERRERDKNDASHFCSKKNEINIKQCTEYFISSTVPGRQQS